MQQGLVLENPRPGWLSREVATVMRHAQLATQRVRSSIAPSDQLLSRLRRKRIDARGHLTHSIPANSREWSIELGVMDITPSSEVSSQPPAMRWPQRFPNDSLVEGIEISI